MTRVKRRQYPLPVLAGRYLNVKDGGNEEYWWDGKPGKREARVIRTDRFGQRWTLEVGSTHFVTYRVAAGLLNVTVPTIHSWVDAGKLSRKVKRLTPIPKMMNEDQLDLTGSNSPQGLVFVVPLKEVARVAEERGLFLHESITPLPKPRPTGPTRTQTQRRGGGKNANQG